MNNMPADILQCLKKGKSQKKLIFFPYLGGYANAFLKLAASFNEEIDVWGINLPGHGGSKQKVLKDINTVVDLCLPLLTNLMQDPCVFYGHSMGGIIAYFLIQRILLDSQYSFKPSALILSACSPPIEFAVKKYSNLSDDDLLKYIISYEGIPEELIQDKSFLQYLLPILRADFKILESSASLECKPLDVPVYYFWGESDKVVPINNAIKWSNYFVQDIKFIPIQNGSHFFIHNQGEHVVKLVENIFN